MVLGITEISISPTTAQQCSHPREMTSQTGSPAIRDDGHPKLPGNGNDVDNVFGAPDMEDDCMRGSGKVGIIRRSICLQSIGFRIHLIMHWEKLAQRFNRKLKLPGRSIIRCKLDSCFTRAA